MNLKKLTTVFQDETKFKLILYTIIIITGSVLWLFRILMLANLFENPHGENYWFTDYKCYYEASSLYLKGENFYNGTCFYYTPISLIFFLPFAFLPFEISAWAFFFLNLIILLVTFKIMLHVLCNYSVTIHKSEKIFLMISIFMFYPISTTFTHGQVNILILFFVVLVFHLVFIKDRLITAALTIFLSTSFKLWPIVLSSVKFFVDNSKKLFLYSILLITIGVFASFGIFGFATHTSFLAKLLDFQKIKIYDQAEILNVKDPLDSNCSFFNILSKIFSLLQIKYDDFLFLLIKLFIGFAILILLIISKNRIPNSPKKQILVFNLIVASIFIFSNIFWLYHFSFLILSYLFYIYALKTHVIERFIILLITFLVSFQEYIVFVAKIIGGYLALLVYIFPPTGLAYLCFFGLVINSTVKAIGGK